ncbi:prephenate dehydrogenase (NADP(+)) [Nowakowskiella sp. JEL0407]|nr:prephenate dehydrogenase (NADP(+)) [Nowakowskiella sp. JEL0407]
MEFEREKETKEIGIIGFGEMGRLYADLFLKAGWKNINVSDLPSKYEALKKEFKDSPINVLPDGHAVSRRSDYILYSVEAALITSVVKTYGPSTKVGAVVGGQTSVKEPEIKAFETYLPPDVHIVSCHSLHGPSVSPKGQPLVIIRHRSEQEPFEFASRVLSALESKPVHLTFQRHDRITADTQAVTHVAFLSMGCAWRTQKTFPWENPSYLGGIENVKIAMTLRIYHNKWHVYAGLAIMNPSAKIQVRQFSQSVSDLFKLMIQEKEKEFTERVYKAADFVFGRAKAENLPILLSDDLLDQFSLSAIPKEMRKPNSHLSLLAMVDSWCQLGINPYDHLICQTPPFRLLLGITEYCFRKQDFLDEAIKAALYDKNIRPDDMEYYSATKGWVDCIELGSFETYQKRFEETAEFFKDRLPHATQTAASMIKVLTKNE